MASDLQFGLNDGTPAPPLRVLIVRVGAMGDVLHGLPAVAALREKIPDCFIGWAVEPRWKSLLVSASDEPPPIVSRIHEVPTREWKRQTVSLLPRCARSRALRRELAGGRAMTSAWICRARSSPPWWGGWRGRSASWARAGQPSARRVHCTASAWRSKAAHVIQRACELVGAALTDIW